MAVTMLLLLPLQETYYMVVVLRCFCCFIKQGKGKGKGKGKSSSRADGESEENLAKNVEVHRLRTLDVFAGCGG